VLNFWLIHVILWQGVLHRNFVVLLINTWTTSQQLISFIKLRDKYTTKLEIKGTKVLDWRILSSGKAVPQKFIRQSLLMIFRRSIVSSDFLYHNNNSHIVPKICFKMALDTCQLIFFIITNEQRCVDFNCFVITTDNIPFIDSLSLIEYFSSWGFFYL